MSRTVIVDELLDILHDLSVPPMGGGSHLGEHITALVVGCCRL